MTYISSILFRVNSNLFNQRVVLQEKARVAVGMLNLFYTGIRENKKVLCTALPTLQKYSATVINFTVTNFIRKN